MTVARSIVSGAMAVMLLAAAGDLGAQTVPIPAGTWQFVPEQSQQIDEAVSEAVSHMNFLVRGIARSRLRGANRPITRIVIQYPENDVYISLREDEPPVVSPQTGEFATHTRSDGELVQVKTELGDRVIRQFFDSDDGQKEHVYRLRPDGTLALEVTVHSEKLRAPLTYIWVYRQ